MLANGGAFYIAGVGMNYVILGKSTFEKQIYPDFL